MENIHNAFKNVCGTSYLNIDSSHIDECMAYYFKHNVDYIVINQFNNDNWRYTKKDIEFLRSYPDIRGVMIPFAAGFDISPIFSLSKLKLLDIRGFQQALDLSAFPLLEEFGVQWDRNILNIDKIRQLKTLDIFKFTVKCKNIYALPQINTLEHLSILQSNITSLSGIDRFPHLKGAEFIRLTKLCDIDNLRSLKLLEELTFDVCKKVNDFGVVSNLLNLRDLAIPDCGTIRSILPFLSLPKIQRIVLMGTRMTSDVDKKVLDTLRKRNIYYVI